MILGMTMAFALATQTNQAMPPRRPRANLNQYFSTDDYPPTAAARGAHGTVRFRLDIGADGAVTGCTITRSSSDAALDAATCAILLGRVRYEPARDSAGRAVASKDVGRVLWRLPPPAPGMPFARFVTVSRLSSNGAGQVDCLVTTNGVAQRNGGPNHCGDLSGTGFNEMLRQAPARAVATLVSVAGPVDAGVEAVGPGEAGYGVRVYDVVSDLVIAQNGRIAQCSILTSNMPPSVLATEQSSVCDPPPPGAPALFEATADPAPRHARHRFALYIKGWPVEWQPPPATPASPRP